MRYISLLILILFFFNNLNAQNLVLNPGFESYKECQVNSAPNDSLFRKGMPPIPFYADHWYFPFFSTADYYNSNCKPLKGFTRFDLEIPGKEENGCAGFNLFAPDGHFEPITGTFSVPLQKDSVYKVSFKLCYLKKYSSWYSKKIELKFTNTKQVFSLRHLGTAYNDLWEFDTIYADKEINISSLADSTFYKEFNCYYKARGGEKYITFGMFFQKDYNLGEFCSQFASLCWRKLIVPWLIFNRDTPVLVFDGKISKFTNLSNQDMRLCYYFLDDVSVERIPTGKSRTD